MDTAPRCHEISLAFPPPAPVWLTLVRHPRLAVIEELSEVVARRERLASWEQQHDITLAWPIDLPMLVCGRLGIFDDETIEMVGMRATEFQVREHRDFNRSRDYAVMLDKSRKELVAIAHREAQVPVSTRLTKEQLMVRILDARYPVPTVPRHPALDQLWDDELTDGNERIRIERSLRLMDDGSQRRLDGFVVDRKGHNLFEVDGQEMSLKEATAWIRTQFPAAEAA